MRRPRLKAPASHEKAYYHCISRVVNRDFVLGELEKEQFVAFMRIYERLYGLRVLTYCVMSNHFHVLVEVPRRPEESELPDDVGLVAHVRSCMGDRQADGLAWDLFRSVLVEGEGHALKAMAAYIELNPVRAKICDDPKDYRWCGYGEAVAGGKEAREAVQVLTAVSSQGGEKVEAQKPKSLKKSLESWRCFLFGVPEPVAGKKGLESRMVKRRSLSKERSLEVLEKGGRLSEADFIHQFSLKLSHGSLSAPSLRLA